MVASGGQDWFGVASMGRVAVAPGREPRRENTLVQLLGRIHE